LIISDLKYFFVFEHRKFSKQSYAILKPKYNLAN